MSAIHAERNGDRGRNVWTMTHFCSGTIPLLPSLLLFFLPSVFFAVWDVTTRPLH